MDDDMLGERHDFAWLSALVVKGGVTDRFERMEHGLLFGAVFSVPGLFAALISAGAGHGDYVVAAYLYPYSIAFTPWFAGTIGTALVVFALVQYPLYCVLVTAPTRTWARMVVVALLTVAHVAAIREALHAPGFASRDL